MATATVSYEQINDDLVMATWNLTSADTDGQPVGPQFSSYADRTVQVTGTAGGSSVWTIQGSNDGTNWGLLNDLFGGDLNDIAANVPRSIAEAPLYMRPFIGTAGTTADLVWKMLMRKSRSGRAAGG